MSAPLRVGVIGATGAVGTELLTVLGERNFPVEELRAFASEKSMGEDVELFGDAVGVEPVDLRRVLGCELIFCAAPDVLGGLLPSLRESPTRVIDLSGTLELDPAVPLYLPGWSEPIEEHVRWLAIPRGVAAGAALVLGPLGRAAALERVTLVTLEPASGRGNAGTEELSEQTVTILNSMTGDSEPSAVFPQSLAFDCLPQVGDLLDGGESSEEARLRHVLRRLLDRPALAVEVTRLRAPIFGGSLICAHARFAQPLDPTRARELWAGSDALRVLDDDSLPTPRTCVGAEHVAVGRVRADGTRLAFAIALDDLQRGSALSAVLAAEAWAGR